MISIFKKKVILVLAHVFENFRKIYLEYYQLDPPKFLSAQWLAWHAALKTEAELELLMESIYC